MKKKQLIEKLFNLGIQLRVVEGNLKVNAPKGVLNKEILGEIKANKPYLLAFLSSGTSIPKVKEKAFYDLTPTQYFMWFTHEYLDGGKAYTIAATLQLEGALDSDVLEQTFQGIVNKHESLRTVFKKNQEGEVKQYILDATKATIKINTIQHNDFNTKSLHHEIEKLHDKKFDLKQGLPISASLLSNGKNDHILVVLLHHIVGDGWSLQLLSKEVIQGYNALINGLEIETNELQIQYKDYSEWLNEQLTTTQYEEKLNYWKSKFETYSPPLNLSHKKRPAIKTYDGNTFDYSISRAVVSKIKQYIQEEKMTLFMVLFGGLNGVFYKYTGQTDITLGTTVAGREHQDLENQIGLYSNALAIRSYFDESITFAALMQEQKEMLLEAYKNKEYPFTKLINELQIPKNTSRSPLFDIMVLLQNHRNLEINDQNELKGINAKEYSGIERHVSQQDLSFVFFETENDLRVTVEYNTDIYDAVFVEKLLQHFERFINKGIEKPTIPIDSISIISAQEEHKIRTEFNATINPYAERFLLIDQLQHQVNTNPENIALHDNSHTISYQEMEDYSNQLANYFSKNYDFKDSIYIGIELPREAWTIITMLAILKIGGTYIPIDPSYPKVRKKYIEEDTNCQFVITAKRLKEIKTHLLEESKTFDVQIRPESTAYIIYTSGSTGKPKGVPISYRAMSDYVKTFATYFKLSSKDTIMQQASISFDTSVEEIFPILTSGGRLVFHEDKSDFNKLFELCEYHKVTILSTNPYVLQYLNQHIEKYKLEHLKTLISGGDELQFSDIVNLYQKINVFNTYGPTESTVCATYYHIDKQEEKIPIGMPIANRQVLILDPKGTDLSPIGIKGEICIAGEGLSSGYLNHSELTAEKFISHPYQANQYIYRTGDIGYWTSNGTIIFVGRNDSQVKIRGYRIELGEIEKTIAEHKSVSGVVVLPKIQNDEKTLVAYITGVSVDTVELKKELVRKVPEYMIPQEFSLLEVFPVTINGKIDKKKLLEFKTQKVKTSFYKAPKTDIEKELVLIWEHLLNIDKVGIEDNFFELGGHSLKAVRFINALEEKGYDLGMKEIFQNPTIAGIIPLLNTIAEEIGISKAPEMVAYPTTSSQRRIWTLSQFDGGSIAYNINSALKITGFFNISLFQEAVNHVVARHESLRTYFKSSSEGVQQIIIPKNEVKNIIDIYHTTDEQEIASIVQNFTTHTFDLTKASLLKISAIAVDEKAHIILINLHHIIGDGWSIEVLFKEVVENYNLLKAGNTLTDQDLSFQFKDYAYYLENAKHAPLEEAKQYWSQQLSGEIPVLELPMSHARPAIKTYNGSQTSHVFTTEFTEKLRNKVKENDATLFMGLMAAINGLLYRYTELTDITLGTPVAGRHKTAIENQIGLFLNTLVIRTRFESQDTFSDLLQKQKQVLIGAYSHQEYPFDNLLEELQIKRNTSRSALFDVMVVLHNQHDLYVERKGFSGTAIEPYSGYENQSSQFDISFSFIESQDTISVSISYNTDIYDRFVIDKMISYLENFVVEAINNPTHSVAKVNYLPKEEELKLIAQRSILSNTNKEETILNILAQQCKETPNAVAIVSDTESITYKELDEKSNELANYLIAEKNIKTGDFVGIKLERNKWLIITILAVLKSGAVYVPIDIAYPADRIQYIEKDSACVLSITQNEIAIFLENDVSIEPPSVPISQQDTAYIIYTSGSTGKPKGVQISHGNLVAFITWCKKEFGDTDFQTMYASTSHCFDLSLYEMFYPLSIGKQIRLLTNALDIPNYIETDREIFINTVPSVIENLVERKISLEQVVAINMAGEPIPIALSNKLIDFPIELRNLYGPSEATTYSSCYRITKHHDASLPIGRPIDGTNFYILSEEQSLQGEGLIGEIGISGKGLSKGYLNKEELTDQKFITNPFVAGEKMYLTGDLGYWLPDGNIGFIGRKDHQVKLRGYRIELEEIAYTLQEHASIQQAVVLIKEESGEKYLSAYVTGEAIDITAVRSHLTEKLPLYMIPAYFEILDAIPLMPNGKTDKNKLLAIDIQKANIDNYKAPKTDIEKELVLIWEHLLNIDKVGIEDNFFELGGHSLKAVRFINALEEKGYDLGMKEIFQNPTIAGIIPLLNTIDEEIGISKAPEMVAYPTTSSQRRIWTLSQFDGGSIAYNINSALKITGFFNISLFQEAVNHVVARHESLRTYFKSSSEGVQQIIIPKNEVKNIIDVYHTTDEQEIASIVQNFTTHTFDLTKAPLLKISAIAVDEKAHIILINLHHIIGDGWSIEVLFKEVVENYNLLKAGNTLTDQDLSFQFKDYAYYLENAKHAPLEEAKQYWSQQLSGEIPVLELPMSHARPAIKTYNGSQTSHVFTTEFTEKLRNKVKENDATLFMGLMAAINGLLYRYTELTDITLGTPVAGRHKTAIENQIGLFLNTLVIRTRFESQDTFSDLLQKQKQVLIGAYSHQEYPFDNLLEELQIKRNTSRSALFDVMVVLHNQHDLYVERKGFSGTAIEPYSGYENQSSQFDISFSFIESQDTISVSISYNTDIYDRFVIDKMISYLENFVVEAINNPTHSVAKVNYLPKEEELKLIAQRSILSNTNKEETILNILAQQCKETPNAVAIVSDTESITYKELDEKSNELANYLIAEKNIKTGDFVGIKLERNKWLIITILAVLKSGAVYVPIDIAYPADRIQYIEKDSACVLSITQNEIAIFLENDVSMESPLVPISQQDTAYIIYTSGSTGKPKGVQISHGNLVAFIIWCKKEFGDTDFQTMYASTSHCFDLSLYEMFYPLSIGKQIRLLTNALDIPNYIETDREIFINTVPSVIENLVERKISLEQVVAINMAGEPIPIALSNKLIDFPIELRNLYGPSEATTYSSCYRITKHHDTSLPIGRPIDGTNFYILSEEQSLQGEGLIGEIGISGKGLSKGYLNKEELTDQKFITNPFVAGEKMYLTGDLGYWLPDGNIGFIGRKDHQVKLRGYRIELEEIAYTLQEHASIQQAVVLIKEESGEKYLSAYVTGETIDITAVRSHLTEKLPLYMIPAYFEILDAIPLMPNGKTDKNKLLAIDIQKANIDNYKAPETDIEKELVLIWEHLLNISKIGVLDDFFEIGGHSLHITRMLYEINEKYDIQISLKNVFIAKNITDLASLIEDELMLKQGFSTDTQEDISNKTEIWEI
ncbi:Tyrocidine synthase 3 [Kordia antarctica]|uniref:Tyrocidine synthase 3 n=1 Tax=Kordia antarctica TaxID=1218801 RepID=A0A7L4ZGS5_9FLAO|nr:non-ribosomal peptide synthetase [Kordia antarctica]QHI35456.1 Tyrocidine synthase 3 [Kordia antarctica]